MYVDGKEHKTELTDEQLRETVECCKCHAKLRKHLDTYRFTHDGKPICYDCEES